MVNKIINKGGRIIMITYSIEYGMGARLEELTKGRLHHIEGEIISKCKTWVIETDKGTVIIPFKAIIHMYPKE